MSRFTDEYQAYAEAEDRAAQARRVRADRLAADRVAAQAHRPYWTAGRVIATAAAIGFGALAVGMFVLAFLLDSLV